jgi:hypothetical protein
MYVILRNFLFRFDAEKVHYFSMNMLKKLCALAPTKYLIKKLFYSLTIYIIGRNFDFRNSSNKLQKVRRIFQTCSAVYTETEK